MVLLSTFSSNQKPGITVIAIHSYKGGTGKTLTAVNLATTLSKQGKRIALLDMDFGAPSLYTYFPAKWVNNASTLNDVLLRGNELSSALIDASSLIDTNGSLYVGLASHHNDQTRKMVRRGVRDSQQDAKKLFNWIEELDEEPYNVDYLFLDTAPGLNFLSVNSISACDISILLMRLLNADLTGTKEMIDGLHSKLATDIMLLVNQLPVEYLEGEDAKEIQDLVQKYIIDHIEGNPPIFGGIIAKDMDLVRLEAENMLELLRAGQEKRDIYVLKNEEGAFSKSITSIIDQLEDTIE